MGGCVSSGTGEKFENDFFCDFTVLRIIGKGAFGKVKLIQNNKTKQIYVLKYITKARCSETDAENFVVERDILESIFFPYVVPMRFSFQDREHLFLVSDFMSGGTVDYQLGVRGRFSEELVRLYAAELIYGVGYLHTLGIIHRDIKPSNLLFDSRGHINITDFNVATIVSRMYPYTCGRIGTPSYMAPEVISGYDYSFGADLWSIGVVVLQMLSGTNPFSCGGIEEIKHAVAKEEHIAIDRHIRVSQECYDFVSGLLTRDPKERLGYGSSGLESICKHSFFREVDWGKISRKKTKMPFIPDSENANYSSLLQAEEQFAEKAKEDSGGAEQTGKAIEYLEGSFSVYDWRNETVEGRLKRGANKLKQMRQEAPRRKSEKTPADFCKLVLVLETKEQTEAG
ncbi:MAG: AGC protein kinase [Amphiamblys sp. WSBS2006]|nr:MAG: AGC protein kinase [Amphiamblys sp. WSBS2006]